MKIEKKKVIGNSRLSKATKAGVASLLGMSAILMSGCLDDAESSPVAGPIEPDNNTPKSPENTSSSSVVDIPLSHERLSSEAIEALSSSSVQTPSKRSSSSYYISSGVSSASLPIPNSSSAAKPTSSATPPASSATEPASSAANSSSSSNVESPASSSSGCHDDDRGMIASMVSTYEMLDLS